MHIQLLFRKLPSHALTGQDSICSSWRLIAECSRPTVLAPFRYVDRDRRIVKYRPDPRHTSSARL